MNLQSDLKKLVDQISQKTKADLKKAGIQDTGTLAGTFEAKVSTQRGTHRISVTYQEYGLILQHISYQSGETKIQKNKRKYRIIARSLKILEDQLVELVALHYEGLFVETIDNI